MRKVLVTPASFKPVLISEIKDFPDLRISGTAEDAILERHLLVAIEDFELYTRHVLCSSIWDLYLDCFPRRRAIELPAPLVSVATVKYQDQADVQQILSDTYYDYDTSDPVVGRLVLKTDYDWPGTYGEINDVIIRFTAGFASANAIPAKYKHGLILKIAELYDGIDRSERYQALWCADRRILI